MLPAAEPDRLCGEEHVLADRGRLAEDIVAGLPFEDRQRQHLPGVDQTVLEPAFRAGRARAVAVVDDVHAAPRGRIATQSGIDELRNQRDQRSADVADRHEQRGPGPIRIPVVVSAHRRRAAGNVEPAAFERSPLRAVDREQLAALLHGFDLAHLAGRDVVVEDIKPLVVGEEQRGVAAGARGREGAAAARGIGRRRRQVPERESGKAGAGADQQRLLEFGQRHRRMRGLVAKRPRRHLEAKTEAPGAPAIDRLEQGVAPGLVEGLGRTHDFDPCKVRERHGTGRAPKLSVIGSASWSNFAHRDRPLFSEASLHGWADLYAWQLDRASRTPLSRQIYMQVCSAVVSGALAAGTRMPSSRAMASRLGVARASVVSAYEQLLAEGYVESRHGSGTFISSHVAGLATRRRARRAIKRAVPTTARAFPDFERSGVQGEARPFNTGRTLIDARTA